MKRFFLAPKDNISILRHILLSTMMGIGLALGLTVSVPLGIAVVSLAAAGMAFVHVCVQLDSEFIPTDVRSCPRP